MDEFIDWWRVAGAEYRDRMTALSDDQLTEEERARRVARREAAAAAARLKAEEKMRAFERQLKRDVLLEWGTAAKAQRKERHAGMIAKIRARMGNHAQLSALTAWIDFVRQVKAVRQAELERVSATALQSLVRSRADRKSYTDLRDSTTHIQRLMRGRLTRGDLYMKHKTAAQIQAAFKGRCTRLQKLKRKPGRGEVRGPADQSGLLAAGAPPARCIRGGRTEQMKRAAAAKEGRASSDEKARALKEEHTVKKLERQLSKDLPPHRVKEKLAQAVAERLRERLEEQVLKLDERDYTGGPEDIYREAIGAMHWMHDVLPATPEIVHTMVELDAIPRLLKLTSDGANVDAQLNVAWVLTNMCGVASPEDMAQIIDQGVLRVLTIMLFHVDGDVREQAVWCLGNVVADSTTYRDLALHEGVMAPLVAHSQTAADEAHLNDHVAPGRAKRHWARRIARTLHNLCVGSPAPEFLEVEPALPLLGRLLFEDDDNVLDQVLIALASFSTDSRERVHAVLSCADRAAERLVAVLKHPVQDIRAHSLCVIANICAASRFVVTGNDCEVQSMIDAGLLAQLVQLLHADMETQHAVIRRACRVLANICAGTRAQLYEALDNDATTRTTPIGRIIPLMCSIIGKCSFSVDYERGVIEEAAWVINNVSLGAKERAEEIFSDGCLQMFNGGDSLIAPAICASDESGSTLKPALEALRNLIVVIRDEGKLDWEDFEGVSGMLAHICSTHGVTAVRAQAGAILTSCLGYTQQQTDLLCAQSQDLVDETETECKPERKESPPLTDHEAARKIQSLHRGRSQRLALMLRKPGRGEMRRPVSFWSAQSGIATEDMPLKKSSRQGNRGAELSDNRKSQSESRGNRRKQFVVEQIVVLRKLQPLVESHEIQPHPSYYTGEQSMLGQQVESGACAAFAALRDLHAELCIGDVDQDLIPIIVSFMRPTVTEVLQLEAAWTLTNMTAGKTSVPSQRIGLCGGIKCAVELLLSSNGDIREQAVWLLGNIAADGAQLREKLLSVSIELPHGQGHTTLLELLCHHAQEAKSADYLHEVVGSGRFLHHWARRIARLIANLCCHGDDPEPPFDRVRAALPVLAELIGESDKDVLDHTLVALQALSADSRQKVNAVMRSADVVKRGVVVATSNRMCESLVALLKHHIVHVRARALAVIANICAANGFVSTGDDSEVQAVLDGDLLPQLLEVLHSDMATEHCVLRRACRVLANVCAGTTRQVQAVLAVDATSRRTPTGRFFPLLCRLLEAAPSTHLDIVEEVVWIINNASHSAVKRDFEVMDKDGCFAALEYTISPSVATQDTDGVILRPALEAVGNMLRGIRQMEQDVIDGEVLEAKQLGRPLEHLLAKQPTEWSARVPAIFLQRLAERHMNAGVQANALAVLAEFGYARSA